MSRSMLLGLAAVLAAGCAQASFLGRWRKKPVLPYLEHPRFSFEYPRRWGEISAIPGGARLADAESGISFSIVFVSSADAAYLEPDRYRRDLAAAGAVEDRHLVFDVAVDSHPAGLARYTTYDYDARTLLGEKVQVWFDEVILVPETDGEFVIGYHAPKSRFWDREPRRHYDAFLKSLVLAGSSGRAEEETQAWPPRPKKPPRRPRGP